MTSKDQIKGLDEMYKFYNRELFGGKLAPAIISLTKSGPRGYFIASRWKIKNDSNPVEHQIAHHEIAINIDKIGTNNSLLHSTLVHEMVHLWQEDLGKPSKNGWHNQEWADMMEKIGLIPSKTGQEGGKKIGYSIDHYIREDGKFFNSYNKIKGNEYLPFELQIDSKNKNEKSAKNGKRTIYICECKNKVWGKSGLDNLFCKGCNANYVAIK
jgi:predicted SprT family Zn-dependent metalloprotease